MPRRLFLLWLLIASLFTLIQVRQSLHGGRLAMPTTYDDVAFLRDGQLRLQVLYDRGPVAAVTEVWRTTPHSPWSSYLAVAAFLAFGMHEWAPAAANGLLVLGVLLWLGHRARRLPPRWQLALASILLTWPLLGQAVENFRPDLACGLVTAALTIAIVREPWLDAGARRHYLAGAGFALALLIKPTISPVTSLVVVTALSAATLTEMLKGRSRPAWREIAAAWTRCLGTGALLAAPYYAAAIDHLAPYVYRNTFGELKDVWSPRLDSGEQALYYLSGAGGRLMLGSWLYLWLALAAAALLAALLRRNGKVFARLPAVAAVLAVSYAAVTLPAHKNPFLGTVLPCLLLMTAVEMMVYLAAFGRPGGRSGARESGWKAAGRWVLAALLLAGVGLFRWPYQLTEGGSLPPHEIRRHRQLLETVYRDLRHVGGERTRVFFTQISPFLNPSVLEFRAGRDRLERFVSRDLQLSKEPLELEREMALADHVIAFSPDNRNAMDWLPGAQTQRSILERLDADPEFVLAGIYGTVNSGEAYLFTRATGFRGIRPLAGLGPLEGPYPQWGLHFRVRWAMGPVTRFEVRLPVAARVRLAWDARSDFPDQTITLKISGRPVHTHAFSAPSVFEHGEVFQDLTAGRHLVELEHSHWHAPSERDDRPLAVLLRNFTALPHLESTTAPAGEGEEQAEGGG